APPNPYLSEVTGLFGPYSSADHAAIAAEPILRAATDRDGRELGILIIRHKETGSFYLTPPVLGSLWRARFHVGGAVDAEDFKRSRNLAFQGCDRSINSYTFYATAHSHPRQPLNPLSDDVFSGADFDGAIKDAKSTARNFDRIYLFPPDRCIRSFKAERGDAECRAIECPQYYPRVQPVHNCPRGRDAR
ncbi:MAG TPA: hypothetical protein VJT10_10695, partial [Steroidobacteraceae bacterium]|nr:hypothetical protein [Steroidobacteraceae bacterium]